MRIDTRGRGRRRNGQVLDTTVAIWLIGNTEKLLSLLLFEHTHLVLKKLAVDETLAFVLETFQLNTLVIWTDVELHTHAVKQFEMYSLLITRAYYSPNLAAWQKANEQKNASRVM